MITTLEEQKRVFSARFRSLRKEGQTQADFAASLGLSRASVINYESGGRIADTVSLAKIATACNVTADWLLGLTDDKNREVSTVDELGLTPLAIERLKEFNRPTEGNETEKEKSQSLSYILSYILEDSDFTEAVKQVCDALWSRGGELSLSNALAPYTDENGTILSLDESLSEAQAFLQVIQSLDMPKNMAESAIGSFRGIVERLLNLDKEQIDMLLSFSETSGESVHDYLEISGDKKTGKK